MSEYSLKNFQGNSISFFEEKNIELHYGYKFDEFCRQGQEICNNFLTLSAASLLVDMKLDLFFINLSRAAENWRRILVSTSEYYQCEMSLAYHAPIYGAIISRSDVLADGLLKALPRHWKEGEEYEDEFHLCWLLLLVFQSKCMTTKDIDVHLGLLEGASKDTTNVVLMKSLLGLSEHTEEDFWSAFETALYTHEELTQKRIESFSTHNLKFIAHRYIWFQGLAWLKLAQLKGYSIPSSNIKYCPDEALVPVTKPYNNDWLLVPIPDKQKIG